MEKKYNLSPVTECNKVGEPAISWLPLSKETINRYPDYSVEELRDRVDRSLQEIKEGKVFTQEEMRKRHSF